MLGALQNLGLNTRTIFLLVHFLLYNNWLLDLFHRGVNILLQCCFFSCSRMLVVGQEETLLVIWMRRSHSFTFLIFERKSFALGKETEINNTLVKRPRKLPVFSNTYSTVVSLILICPASLADSNLFAIVTLCPKRQYRGIFLPTTPAKTVPVCNPMRI